MNRILSIGSRPALLALLGLALAGCGPGWSEVSGTVRCDGKPLPFGTIQFLGPDGIPRASAIGADGTFSVRVRRGEAKVIVSCMEQPRLEQADGEASRGRAVARPEAGARLSLIPQRYADWTASGLTLVVTGGKQQQDFTLSSN
jgi:hypothetical protein